MHGFHFFTLRVNMFCTEASSGHAGMPSADFHLNDFMQNICLLMKWCKETAVIYITWHICTTLNIELFANYNGKEESFAFSVTRCISHTTNQKEKEDRSRVIQLDRGGDENSSFPPSQTGSRKRAPSALFWCFKPVPHTH